MDTTRDRRIAPASAAAGGDMDVPDVANPNRIDESCDTGSNHDQLSSEDFVELTRISRKKHDIEGHITSLQGWPAWNPFRDVSSYSIDLTSLERSKAFLDAITSELRDRQKACDRLDLDVQQFNLEDMKRLRSVAKAVSKRHLSGPDTDLLELALDTVFALDKLLRLLRERRNEHDLTDLRLQWERLIYLSWCDVVELRRSINAFEHKCETITAPQSSSTNSASVVGVGEREDSATGRRNTSNLQHMPRSASSSFTLLSESLKLESSRLVLRIRSFDTERVRPAGRLLDLLIDQIQVPERLIDEQEKLEDAVPGAASIEAKTSQVLYGFEKASPSGSQGQSTWNASTSKPKREDRTSEAGSTTTDSGSFTSSLAQAEIALTDSAVTMTKSANRSRKNSSSSLPVTPARQASNRYRSNPRDALDVAIGNIVNRMHISVSIKNASLVDPTPSKNLGLLRDLSGQYWIGDPEPRLCFCRILPSNMVMIRVGGGWQELSEFLTQHYAHLDFRGVQDDTALVRGSNGKQASRLTWMRSASGPAGLPRFRTQSSAGLFRSSTAKAQETARHSSSPIVTTPTMHSISTATPLLNKPSDKHIPGATRRQDPVEQSGVSFSTPCKASRLPRSGSASSVVVRSSSPSP